MIDGRKMFFQDGAGWEFMIDSLWFVVDGSEGAAIVVISPTMNSYIIRCL